MMFDVYEHAFLCMCVCVCVLYCVMYIDVN